MKKVIIYFFVKEFCHEFGIELQGSKVDPVDEILCHIFDLEPFETFNVILEQRRKQLEESTFLFTHSLTHPLTHSLSLTHTHTHFLNECSCQSILVNVYNSPKYLLSFIFIENRKQEQQLPSYSELMDIEFDKEEYVHEGKAKQSFSLFIIFSAIFVMKNLLVCTLTIDTSFRTIRIFRSC
jgi:hypothetical protein